MATPLPGARSWAGDQERWDGEAPGERAGHHGHAYSETRVLGVDLQALPRGGQFAACAGGVFLVYQLYAYLQEGLFHIPGFTFTWSMTLAMFFSAAAFAQLERLQRNETARRGPWSSHAVVGVLTFVSVGFTAMALNHVNYPISIVFKSAKVIPVMLAGFVVMRKRYSGLEYLSSFLFFLGLSLFTLADVHVSPKFDAAGVALLLLALASDAFLGNVQERLMTRHGVSSAEMCACSYVVAGGMNLAVVLATGELRAAMRFCTKHPDVYWRLLLFCTASYVGLQLVLASVKLFGAVTTVVVTSCRKLLTICLSFVFFPKPWTNLYLLASLLLFAGTILNVYAKHPAEARRLRLALEERWGGRGRGGPKGGSDVESGGG